MARALEANPDVQKSLEDLARLDGVITEAKADALPELNVYGTFNRYRDPSLLNSSSFDSFPPDLIAALKPVPANLYEGTAQIRQTLFSFKLGHAIKAARLGRLFGQEELERARQLVALAAVVAYNDFLLGLERAKVVERSVAQKEKQLEIARNRRASGVATDLDVLRFQVDLENERAQLLRDQGQADLAARPPERRARAADRRPDHPDRQPRLPSLRGDDRRCRARGLGQPARGPGHRLLRADPRRADRRRQGRTAGPAST